MDDQVKSTNQQDPVNKVTTPVSGGHKELGPIGNIEQNLNEVLKPTEVEPILPPEVEKAGVEVKKAPSLSPQIKRTGIKETGEATKISSGQNTQVNLPMTQVQANKTLKSNNTNSSISWLAMLILKLLKRDNRKVFKNYD